MKYLLFIFIFFSCQKSVVKEENIDDDKQDTGQFLLKLSKANSPEDVVRIAGSLTRSGYETINFNFVVDDTSSQFLIEDIVSGTWLLHANAYDINNVIIYTGSMEITIIAGQVNQVVLTLNPTTGDLDISIVWGDSSIIAIEDGLIGYYPFNGNADDESGNNNHGIVNGPILTYDRFENPNSAYNFDGINDYINVGSNFNFDFNSQFTICAWIKTTQAIGIRVIFSKTENSSNTNNTLFFAVHYNFPRITIRENVGNEINAVSPILVAYDVWYFVATTYNGLNNGEGLKIYVDGTLKNSGIRKGNPVTMVTSDPASIGSDAIGSHSRNFFEGIIDDVRIYNRALKDIEIEYLYNMN